jgi:hypothetical protein
VTKRTFIAMARIVSEMHSTPIYRDAAVWLAHQLATMFREENSRFDERRFMQSCGIIP